MKENFLAVIAANKVRQNKARELNIRAGENLFKVFSRAELLEFALQKLVGARRMAEVTDPSGLVLPPLDEVLVVKVLANNPDEVTVCGRRVAVKYGNRNPIVYTDFRGEQAKDWLRLPEEGIRLPGGREVSLYSAVEGYGYYIEVPSSQFPAKVRECLNAGAWQTFERSSNKPEIVLPVPETDGSEVLAVYEHQYGTCAVTGESLLAFGATAVKGYRYSGESYFEIRWCRKREEAETFRAAAVEKLVALRKEIAERALVEAAKGEAQAAKEHVKDVYGEYQSIGTGRELREALYTRAYAYLPEGLEDLRKWVAETNELTERALAEIAEVKKASRKREEEIAPLVERVGSTGRAEFIHAFAEELARLMGASTAHRRLSREFTADYGRARRQSALADMCKGEQGQRFLALHQARTVDETLEGAIFWLEHKYQLQPIEKLVPAPRTASSPSSSVSGEQVVLNSGAWDELSKLKL